MWNNFETRFFQKKGYIGIYILIYQYKDIWDSEIVESQEFVMRASIAAGAGGDGVRSLPWDSVSMWSGTSMSAGKGEKMVPLAIKKNPGGAKGYEGWRSQSCSS